MSTSKTEMQIIEESVIKAFEENWTTTFEALSNAALWRSQNVPSTKERMYSPIYGNTLDTAQNLLKTLTQMIFNTREEQTINKALKFHKR